MQQLIQEIVVVRLLNSAGDLIGINTAIYTNSFDRSNKGVGFAIPANMVKRVMSDLIDSW